jgi:hypothetical protein
MAKAEAKRETRPSISKALHAVASDADPEGHDIKQVTVQILETGEVVYRMHPKEGDEPLGGTVRTG